MKKSCQDHIRQNLSLNPIFSSKIVFRYTAEDMEQTDETVKWLKIQKLNFRSIFQKNSPSGRKILKNRPKIQFCFTN